ncbi:hypothetical protein ACS0TY_036093 [Phlomoides rotata]
MVVHSSSFLRCRFPKFKGRESKNQRLLAKSLLNYRLLEDQVGGELVDCTSNSSDCILVTIGFQPMSYQKCKANN